MADKPLDPAQQAAPAKAPPAFKQKATAPVSTCSKSTFKFRNFAFAFFVRTPEIQTTENTKMDSLLRGLVGENHARMERGAARQCEVEQCGHGKFK
jgi:hypothetical protein